MRSTLVLIMLIGLALGYQPSTNRRNLLQQALVGVFVASSSPAEAVISSKYCSAGVGEGCGDLSEGNELIRSLQEKSAMNRERYQQEALDAYYMKNYPDFFSVVGKTLVKKTDGTFVALADSEVEKLKQDGKVTFEIPRTKGGKLVDVTQKPNLVFKE
ncbi:hypothetical protein FisN_2Lh354 [Fistulifera solaris]|uniref:PS II complex 12 kDa extrinsic protein n=1 Tax=Fistulifera solaris TaxID=1519565 RepID=A0A1Z5J7W3_FISSO|nr:hypothetical protein FisN_2Lh354 [Fistulifera solaris]|eukprot:GAX10085.1 hypothetical protein FisN_2Lh354 [Fistulifera solaris]